MIVARAGASWLGVAFGHACTAFRPLFDHTSRALQQMVGTSWLLAPDQAADEAIRWLSASTARLDLAEIGKSRPGALARKLISRYGARCSAEAYRTLESTILCHYPIREKRCYAFRLENYTKGERWYGPNEYGLTQYGLLSALPPERLANRALGFDVIAIQFQYVPKIGARVDIVLDQQDRRRT
jgi:hypothetical protein